MTNKLAAEAAEDRQQGVGKAGNKRPQKRDLLLPKYDFPMEFASIQDADENPVASPWVVLSFSTGHTIAGYLLAEPTRDEYTLLTIVEVNGHDEWIESHYNRRFVISCDTLADADAPSMIAVEDDDE